MNLKQKLKKADRLTHEAMATGHPWSEATHDITHVLQKVLKKLSMEDDEEGGEEA